MSISYSQTCLPGQILFPRRNFLTQFSPFPPITPAVPEPRTGPRGQRLLLLINVPPVGFGRRQICLILPKARSPQSVSSELGSPGALQPSPGCSQECSAVRGKHCMCLLSRDIPSISRDVHTSRPGWDSSGSSRGIPTPAAPRMFCAGPVSGAALWGDLETGQNEGGFLISVSSEYLRLSVFPSPSWP